MATTPPPLISTTTPPVQVYLPFLANNFVDPQETQFWEGSTSPLIRGGGGFKLWWTQWSGLLKVIILYLLGFRFIYIVYIGWYYIQVVSNVLVPPKCLCFKCDSTTKMLVFWFACLSVKLQWMIQVTREIQDNSWILELCWVCCK